jgi:glycosyltransferase involved in cell wall biosynthesis
VLHDAAVAVRRRLDHWGPHAAALATAAPSAAKHALMQRLGELERVLGGNSGPEGSAGSNAGLNVAIKRVASRLDDLDRLDESTAWLLLAVVHGRLPAAPAVVATVRQAELDGVGHALAAVVFRALLEPATRCWPAVRVVTDQVLLDVHNTAVAGIATGVQRVTREVSRRWNRKPDVTMVGWTRELDAVRALSAGEMHRLVGGDDETPLVEVAENEAVLVPWRCLYVVPELATEPNRTERLSCLAAYSNNPLSMIGYDLIPVTTAETCYDVSSGFVGTLTAARHARAVAPISAAAGEEWLGWRRMLAGTGFPGPRIEPVLLPTEVQPGDADRIGRASERLVVSSLPLVLVVGSHEPRKNHLTVLHAAEILWQEGHRFSLSFIGGNAWKSEPFYERLNELVASGRPVVAISRATDDLLWGGYRVARFTVFPSLNEGFGLPLAESLGCGTPAITSNFGAMKEIADEGGGALLVDPRDDRSVTDAMRALLIDDEHLERLRREAAARPIRRWEDYAAEVWEVLTGRS